MRGNDGKWKSGVWAVIAAVVASAMMSCGDAPPDMMSDAMVDAGELLMDAGGMLIDGGRDLDAAGDAMSPSDAAAQDAGGGGCGTCTVDGVVRTVTADTDPTRIESGQRSGDGILVTGPIVITDLAVVDRSTSGGGSARIGISASGTCGGSTPSDGYLQELNGDRAEGSTHGLRIFVPAGAALCTVSFDATSWAGFRPY